MQIEPRALKGDSPGASRHLTAYRFGTAGQGLKVYLQAGLHADEMPGVLVLQHLLPLLEAAEVRGEVTGEVLVVPHANPIGAAQWLNGRPQGRNDLDSMRNFNRGYPDLAALAGDAIVGSLTADRDENTRLIRAAFAAALTMAPAASDQAELRVALLQWSHDADYVLDLHCDQRAVLHLYATSARPADTTLLCRCTGMALALIADISGGNAFDEAHTAPWLHLQHRFPDHPIAHATFATTLEYRGQLDVDDATAASDAHNLMTYLAALGVVRDWPEAPAYPDAPHLPLAGAGEAAAPQGGVVTWAVLPGTMVQAGQPIAHVTDPVTRLRLPVLAPNEGMVFRQDLWPTCLRGQALANVAGSDVVRQGDLLAD
jgi:hypothetical protein